MPDLLIWLLANDRWKHPGDKKMAELIPWFEDPLILLADDDHMWRESRSMDLFADDQRLSELFREVRGSDAGGSVELPWLDIERAYFIAVNCRPGDDVAIALDYRGDPADPRVVASDFWTEPSQCAWRMVTPTFSEFATALGLLN